MGLVGDVACALAGKTRAHQGEEVRMAMGRDLRRARRARVELQLDPCVADRLRRLAADQERTVSTVAQRLLIAGIDAAEEGGEAI